MLLKQMKAELKMKWKLKTNIQTLLAHYTGVIPCQLIICKQTISGFTATLVDIVTTTALLATRRGAGGVSVNLTVNYIAPARIGK